MLQMTDYGEEMPFMSHKPIVVLEFCQMAQHTPVSYCDIPVQGSKQLMWCKRAVQQNNMLI